ncbi:MAG: hypothetical protein ASARMPRED_004233 [Alectoria sarmentosa]|nr:MAG: hypothetical protein ASARMPRED_004233 [Alectoria sarmentosa]
MADYLPHPVSGTALSPGAGHRNPAQQPLSCSHCRQRKIKCDKKYPCSPCSRSNLNCVFPERARHPKKKSASSKATNDELMRRLGRMEDLIEKMKVEGKDVGGKKLVEDGSTSSDASQSRHTSEARSPGSNDPDHVEDGMSKYIGTHFWRSLSSEVQGLKETMDDDSEEEEEEDSQLSGQSPAETSNSQSSVLFGSSSLHQRELRRLHPSPAQLTALFYIYQKNVDPMAKILHIPSLRKLVMSASANIDAIPSGNYVEALLFAMYYAAVTSLTQEESGTESALSNADLLSTKEIGTLQALVIFLTTVRSNDDTMFAWTLFSVAVRLGHSLTLHRESTWSSISPFTREIRRRLWWQMVDLDVRGLEDRGSDPFILDSSFNTKKPLNINDDDMKPESMEPIAERKEFTEMTKSHVSHLVWDYAVRIGYTPPGREDPESLSNVSPLERKINMIQELETILENEVLIHCDPASPIAWVTSVVIRLIGSRLRIAVYHPPLHDMRGMVQQYVSRELVLKTAVQNLEYGHLLGTEPAAAQWRWYFNTRVQWHALAATLAELCVQDKGPLVERAWKVVDVVFEDWAEHIADSRRGMLWRPIKKLMSKAQARRAESSMKSMSISQQQSLPQFTASAYGHFYDPNSSTPATLFPQNSMSGVDTGNLSSQGLGLDQQLSPDVLASLNANEAANAINWAEWDEFMQDFEMVEQPPMDANFMQQDASHLGVWW